MRMARHVEELAARTPGKEALAIESFARALRQIPTIIADNGGYDSSQLVSELRAMHSQDQIYQGLNMVTGEVCTGTSAWSFLFVWYSPKQSEF